MKTKPDLFPDLQYIWNGFWWLRDAVGISTRIHLSDIRFYLDVFGIKEQQAIDFTEGVLALDQVFFNKGF